MYLTFYALGNMLNYTIFPHFRTPLPRRFFKKTGVNDRRDS